MKKSLLSLVLLVGATLALAGCSGSTRSYDVSELAVVSFRGESGEGYVAFVITDTDQLLAVVEPLIEKIGEDKAYKVALALDSIQYRIEEESSELSNGDIIAITTTYDEALAREAKVSFTNLDFTRTVEGLRE